MTSASVREQVRRTIVSAQLLARGDRVLVGVSGGADSVALLHLLVGLKDARRIWLGVVHVDHQLRPESAEDAAFVQQLAERFDVPAVVIRRNVRAEVARRKLSLEEGARHVRYEAFQEAARMHSATRLALAHTADDQAETVLMRLLRGSGLTGLCAIPMSRPLGECTIIRPLLGIWRKDLVEYLQAHRLAFRQDATNDDPRFVRNRIRHGLLPLLERAYNPQIKPLLSQLAEQCRTDLEFLQAAAQRHWKRLVKRQNGHLEIRVEGFVKQPPAIQRHLIRLALQQLQGDLTGFEFRHWQEIDRLFTQRPAGTLVDLPGQAQLERTSDRVLVRVRPAPSPAAS